MLLRVKVVTSDFKRFYVTISCRGRYRRHGRVHGRVLLAMVEVVSAQSNMDDVMETCEWNPLA